MSDMSDAVYHYRRMAKNPDNEYNYRMYNRAVEKIKADVDHQKLLLSTLPLTRDLEDAVEDAKMEVVKCNRLFASSGSSIPLGIAMIVLGSLQAGALHAILLSIGVPILAIAGIVFISTAIHAGSEHVYAEHRKKQRALDHLRTDLSNIIASI